jgi:two-component system, OmpR family, response regulator
MAPVLLLIDDDPPIRDTFSRFLAKEGFTVYTAEGGEAGLAMLGTVAPDLVLLDIMMEPMDGWETLLAIRDNPATRMIPVMIVTAKPPTRDEIRKYGGEADDVTMKPVDLPTISASVRRAMETNARMNGMLDGLIARGADPDQIREYISLQRMVRITQKLSGRFHDYGNTDTSFLLHLESRLVQLGQELGIPPPPARDQDTRGSGPV